MSCQWIVDSVGHLVLPGDEDLVVAKLPLDFTPVYRYDEPYKKLYLSFAYPRQHC